MGVRVPTIHRRQPLSTSCVVSRNWEPILVIFSNKPKIQGCSTLGILSSNSPKPARAYQQNVKSCRKKFIKRKDPRRKKTRQRRVRKKTRRIRKNQRRERGLHLHLHLPPTALQVHEGEALCG